MRTLSIYQKSLAVLVSKVSIARTMVDSKFKALPFEEHPGEARAACGARSDSFSWFRSLLLAQIERARSFFKNTGNLDDRDCKDVALRAMQIFVKPFRGGRFLIDVMPGDAIYDAKGKIQLAAGFNVDLQRLYQDSGAKAYRSTAEIPEAMQLENCVTLRQIGIHHGDTLVLRCLGEEVDALESCCRIQQHIEAFEKEEKDEQARIEQHPMARIAEQARIEQEQTSEQFRQEVVARDEREDAQYDEKGKKFLTEGVWLGTSMELPGTPPYDLDPDAPCPRCQGTGIDGCSLDDLTCPPCRGTGKARKSLNLKANQSTKPESESSCQADALDDGNGKSKGNEKNDEGETDFSSQEDGLPANHDNDEPMLGEFHQEDAKQCMREVDEDARGERDEKRYAKFLQADAAQVFLEAEHFKQEMVARDARLDKQCGNIAAYLDEYTGKLRALFAEFEEQERRADALDDNNGKSNGKDKHDKGETDDKKDKTPARTRTRSRSRSPRPSIASQPEEEKTSTETPGSPLRRSRNRSPSPSTPWIEPIAYSVADGCKC